VLGARWGGVGDGSGGDRDGLLSLDGLEVSRRGFDAEYFGLGLERIRGRFCGVVVLLASREHLELGRDDLGLPVLQLLVLELAHASVCVPSEVELSRSAP
jgi:hypothetical protein